MLLFLIIAEGNRGEEGRDQDRDRKERFEKEMNNPFQAT
jgi:hypothetical protein